MFNSHRVALVHQHVFRFIVSEVKMPCSCYPKAKEIQSRVRKQNNCTSFDRKARAYERVSSRFYMQCVILVTTGQ